MTKWKYLFLILICLSFTGCAALFTEQEYVLIEQPVTEKPVFYGVIFPSQKEQMFAKSCFLVGERPKTLKFMCVISEIDGNRRRKYQEEFDFRMKSPLLLRQTLSKS